MDPQALKALAARLSRIHAMRSLAVSISQVKRISAQTEQETMEVLCDASAALREAAQTIEELDPCQE